ncbi:MAG: hypothetical protein U1U88_000102 [Lawsonella clevelandensis]
MVGALPSQRVRAAWQLLPDEDLAARVCDLIRIARRAGGAVLVLVPDQYDLDPLLTHVRDTLGSDGIVGLSAASGQAPRYRTWLQALYGAVDVIIGTRAAAFSPLPNLHTVLLLDDGNEISRNHEHLIHIHGTYWPTVQKLKVLIFLRQDGWSASL